MPSRAAAPRSTPFRAARRGGSRGRRTMAAAARCDTLAAAAALTAADPCRAASRCACRGRPRPGAAARSRLGRRSPLPAAAPGPVPPPRGRPRGERAAPLPSAIFPRAPGAVPPRRHGQRVVPYLQLAGEDDLHRQGLQVRTGAPRFPRAGRPRRPAAVARRRAAAARVVLAAVLLGCGAGSAFRAGREGMRFLVVDVSRERKESVGARLAARCLSCATDAFDPLQPAAVTGVTGSPRRALPAGRYRPCPLPASRSPQRAAAAPRCAHPAGRWPYLVMLVLRARERGCRSGPPPYPTRCGSGVLGGFWAA